MPTPFDDIDFTNLFGPAAQSDPERDPFGRIGAGDPGWEQARDAWMGGASLDRLFGDRLFDLNDSVGANRANQRGDVFKVQSLLHREGHLDAEATGGPTGYWGIRDDTAMKGLQKEGGLTVDGWAGPGGETMGYFRDLYEPPRGTHLVDQEIGPSQAAQGQTLADMARDLARQLGLDPAEIDVENPAVLPALGAVRFIRYGSDHDRPGSLQKALDLKASDPALAGRLHALAAEIVSQPQWHLDKMTPEELHKARAALREGNATFAAWEKLARRLLPKPIRRIDTHIVRPIRKHIVRAEERRLDEELSRRVDPRDR